MGRKETSKKEKKKPIISHRIGGGFVKRYMPKGINLHNMKMGILDDWNLYLPR